MAGRIPGQALKVLEQALKVLVLAWIPVLKEDLSLQPACCEDYCQHLPEDYHEDFLTQCSLS